jgi:hypothetical protein
MHAQWIVNVNMCAQRAWYLAKYVARRMFVRIALVDAPHSTKMLVYIMADVVESCAFNAQEDVFMTVRSVRNVTQCGLEGRGGDTDTPFPPPP